MQMGEKFHNNSFDSEACICIWLHVVFQELTVFQRKTTQYTVNHKELRKLPYFSILIPNQLFQDAHRSSKFQKPQRDKKHKHSCYQVSLGADKILPFTNFRDCSIGCHSFTNSLYHATNI